jgi:hypothetical protein
LKVSPENVGATAIVVLRDEEKGTLYFVCYIFLLITIESIIINNNTLLLISYSGKSW